MLTEQKLKVLELYNQGLAAYKEMQWDNAIASFQNALQIDPKDGPSKLYLGRCLAYKDNPPPANWDGVFTMTTK